MHNIIYAFEDEIKAGLFNDGSYNLYGRSMNGSNDVKIALDAARVKALEEFVRDKMPHNENKNSEW